MSISTELFQAILAMDAYNRGYGKKLEVAGTQIGDATLALAADSADAQAASFFAQAYTLSTGQTIISFRGTDDPQAFVCTCVRCVASFDDWRGRFGLRLNPSVDAASCRL
jgi:hypothetical protein